MSQSKGLKSVWTMEGDRAQCHLCDFEGFLGREILLEDESNASIILSVTVSKENNDNMFDCILIEVKFKF